MNIEEFVNSYLQEHRHDVLLNPYNGLIDFANTFKEQMFKDAVESEAEELYNDGESQCVVSVGTYFEPGDKVYVLKAEEG